MAFERSSVRSRPGPLLAAAAALLSAMDGALTIRIGSETNPLLKQLFNYRPETLFIAKGLTVPLLIFLAMRKESLARDGLLLAVGWYAAIVLVEMQFLHAWWNW